MKPREWIREYDKLLALTMNFMVEFKFLPQNIHVNHILAVINKNNLKVPTRNGQFIYYYLIQVLNFVR